MICLEGVQLTLGSGAGQVNILRGIDLSVARGERISVVGPSGSGKTSLMMVIAGLERPTGGSVTVDRQDLGRLDEDGLALFRRDTMGIVFQAFHLVPTMSALENVAVPMEFAGRGDAFDRAEAELAAVGLGERLHHYPGQLSGGEQQRVALARAVAMEPRLLLADEPTGNLDSETGRHIIDLLFDLADRRAATLMLITHDAALAARCDRSIRIADGRIEDRIPAGAARVPGSPMTRNTLAWRLAWRELRGGVRGFRVFIACLILGVAAIAGVGSISESILAGIHADARKLLGGDVDLRLTHRSADAEQRAWLAANADRFSEVAEMRAMVRRPDGATRSLVELKAVDGHYPLFGGLRLEVGGDLKDALSRRDGAWGAAAERRLLDKLMIGVGDRLRLGDILVEITAVIAEESDRGTGALNFGPRLLVALPTLHATGLLQPGSLVRYHYRIDIPDDIGVESWGKRLDERFPDAGWRVRSIANAAPNIQRFVDRATLFLSLVGLTALLVGGVGVGNAVRSYLESRVGTIAILKCLGGPGPLIFRIYLIQVLILAAGAIAAGILIGALAPLAAAPLLAERLPVAARAGIYAGPLVLAGLYGFLITLAFSLWPLAQAREVSPANLFRAVILPPDKRPRAVYLAALAAVLAVLATLAVATAHMPGMAGWFVFGAIVSFAAFHGAARLIIALIRRLPRQKSPVVRLALANLSRPGAPTTSVVLSLGLGLTVLAAVALIEGNLARQITETLPEEAPEFYFIDIQANQLGEFEAIARGIPGVGAIASVPMLRGRITRIKDTPVRDITPPPDFAWILRGDRGLTWSREAPEHGSRVVAGEWWPPDYSGPPLVSFDARAAEAFGLRIGDTITINLLGRDIEARVANLREIDWTTLSINFVMVFSPGLLETAPQVYVATAKTEPAADAALERAVTDRFPNISAIRVKEVLQGVAEILERLSGMVRLIAGVAVAAGALVLAGAVAATHRRRIHDAVLLKVLGATRRKILATYLVEFGVLGLATAGVASVIGSIAAWAVVTFVMHAPWSFIPAAVAVTVALCVAITLVAGFAGTWRALGHKAAPILRNE